MSMRSWAIKAIKKYQQNKQIIGTGHCKHYPTCSNYAIGCYEKFNFVKASFLTLFRIIRCNPFTKKVYDPVPLNRAEKKALKSMRQEVLSFSPCLTKHAALYPLMEIQDYITLIYQSTFGPVYLKDKIKTPEDAMSYLHELYINKPFKMENIGNNYQRLYINKDLIMREMAEDYLRSITMSEINDILIQSFNEKLYLFKQLVKKKQIPLNYNEVFNYIEDYLVGGINYLGHSNTYLKNYPTNYIIIKRDN